MTYPLSLFVWLALLALAYPYVRRAKHPKAKTLAAYLLFVSLFSAVAVVVLLMLIWLINQVGVGYLANEPIGVVILLILVLVPAFLSARWQIRRPPWQRPLPK